MLRVDGNTEMVTAKAETAESTNTGSSLNIT
jgi:hypothetical protein